MPTFKAAIFDLDGTLLDTLDDLADALNHSLKVLGYPQHSRENIRELVGHGIFTLIETALPEDVSKDEKIVFKAVHEMGEAYARLWNCKTLPYPEIPKVLDSLTFKRVPMGILSNKPHPFTVEMCSFFLKKWDFSFITGGREHLPLKPNPAVAYQSLETFQKTMPDLTAQEVLFVGDGDTDVKTALAAGMEPLAALWGFRSKEQLASVGARRFAETPLQILDYF